MKKQFYLPLKERDQVIWLNNFAAKKEEHASVFNFSPAQVASTKNDAKMWAYIVALLSMLRQDMKELTAYKNILKKGPKKTPTNVFPDFPAMPALPTLVDAHIFERAARDVATIKAHDNYSTALGKDFGIIGSDSTFDARTFKAKIEAKAEPGQVRIEFVKSETDGYRIYSRLDGESEWQFLAVDNRSPYFDKRPLADSHTPEVREYRGRAIIDDEEIGLFSAISTVTYSG